MPADSHGAQKEDGAPQENSSAKGKPRFGDGPAKLWEQYRVPPAPREQTMDAPAGGDAMTIHAGTKHGRTRWPSVVWSRGQKVNQTLLPSTRIPTLCNQMPSAAGGKSFRGKNSTVKEF